MSEILDDLNISSLRINDGLNFGGKFVGSVQAGLEGGAVGTPTVVSTTTLITTLNIATGARTYISLASGTLGQMKIIVVTQGSASIQLIFPNDNRYNFNDIGDAITLIYTAEGWVIINSVVID
jgi:hypothetical protein